MLDVELCLPDFNHVNTSIADMQLSHYDYMVNTIKLRNITLIFCGSSFIFFSFTCNFEVLRHFFKSKKKEKNGRVGLVVVKGKPRELGVSTDFGIKFQQDDSHEDRASRRSPNRYSIRRTRFSLQISLFTVSRLVIVRAEHLYPRLWIKSRGNG